MQSGPADAEQTVLLLPGGWCTAVFYQELMAEPALAGIRLVAVTLPGNGGTPAPQDLSVENYARLTAELAERLGCTAVVGHSMGANVALEMAGSGAFTGPVVLLAPSFSRRDEAMIIRVLDRLARVLGRLPFAAMRFMMRFAVKGSPLPRSDSPCWSRSYRRTTRSSCAAASTATCSTSTGTDPSPTVVRGGGAGLGRPRPDRRRRDHRRGATHPAGLPVDPHRHHPRRQLLHPQRGARPRRRSRRRSACTPPPSRRSTDTAPPRRAAHRHTEHEEDVMPKISKENAPNVEDSGPATDIGGPLDDYTVNFVTIRQEHSLAELLKGLPGDSCPCPHWGYLFAGKITVTYAGPGRDLPGGRRLPHVTRARSRRRSGHRIRPVQPHRPAESGARPHDRHRPVDAGR